jgi:hypothetical protein
LAYRIRPWPPDTARAEALQGLKMQKSTETSTSTALEKPVEGNRELRKLVNCPYRVLIDGEIIDEFYDVRDAIAVARLAKNKRPQTQVKVSAQPSGRLIVEI